MYRIQPDRGFRDMSSYAPESMDIIYSRAHDLGLIADVKTNFIKSDK